MTFAQVERIKMIKYVCDRCDKEICNPCNHIYQLPCRDYSYIESNGVRLGRIPSGIKLKNCHLCDSCIDDLIKFIEIKKVH